MSPQKLFLESGMYAGVVYCEKCLRVFRDKELDLAEKCCVEAVCEDCGNPRKKPYTVCSDCEYIRRCKREQEAYNKAEKVLLKDYDGPLWVPEAEKFFSTYDELEEWYYDSEVKLPAWVFACKTLRPKSMSADDVIERMFEHMELVDEDTYDYYRDICGKERLQKELDCFLEKNKNIVSYEEDHKKVVLLESEVAVDKDNAS